MHEKEKQETEAHKKIKIEKIKETNKQTKTATM